MTRQLKPYPQSLPRQTAILQAIADHVKQYNEPPTLAEIGLAVGMTKSHVRYHVRKLEAAGILTYHFNQRRTIQLVNQEQEHPFTRLEKAFEERVSDGFPE
jgi:SOS-response transcriptional repressor LexA